MKKLFTSVIVFLTVVSVYAQQEPHFAFYTFNQQFYNPAFVGSRNTGSFTALHRSQWLGFDGAPTTQILSFQTPIMKSRAGIGGSVSRYQIGFSYDWFASTAYSYNIKLTKDLDLRVGLQATLEYMAFEFGSRDVVTVSQNDPALSEGEFSSKYVGNVGAGMYLTYKDLFYFGGSSPQIYPNQIGFDEFTLKTAEAFPHRYLNAGAILPINDQLELMPNIMIKWVDQAPLDADINFNVRYLDRIMGGLNYRVGGNKNGDSLGLLFYFQANQKIGAGLAYELTISDIKKYESGTVELVVRYDLRDEKTNLENPRFFKKQ
ncbi:MAG: hypothetical protein CMN32_09485 [Saprospirales bacterium]|nr:hypothetical protein [Saprospirales bacterium]